MSIVLRVNSKYKEPFETDSNFRYHLVSSPAAAAVTSLSLISFTCNRLFTNIYDANNTIVYVGSGEIYTFVIPKGQYTATELIAVLSLFQPGGNVLEWTLVANKFNCKMTGFIPLLSISLRQSTIATYIGMIDDVLLNAGEVVELPSYPQLQGPDEIYVQSSILASGQCLDEETLGGSIPLLAAIPCGHVPFGFTVHYNALQMEQHTVYTDNGAPSQLKTLYIQITDRFGNLLNLPANCYVDILFRITYAQ